MRLFFGKGKERRRPTVALVGAFLVGLAAFALYLSTLAPSVLYYTDDTKDSAVIPAAAYVLGISQPTGYPTYMMLAHLFTYLPVGDVAYRVNLFSAVAGALAVAVLYLVGLLLSGRAVPAAVGALIFGASEPFWSQAVVAEVYTLNALFVALVLLVLLLWREYRRDRYLLLVAFLIGLSLTHHLTSGLLAPAALLFVLLVEPRTLLRGRLLLGGAGLFSLGLLPYAYLPLRASARPPVNAGNPDDWEGFERLVSGESFQGRMFAFGPEELPGRLLLYLEHLPGDQLSPLFLGVALAGALCLLPGDRPAFALLGFLFLGWLVYALEYNVEDIRFYFIPTHLILGAFGAAGVGALWGWTEAKLGRLPLPPIRRAAVKATLSVLALSLPLWGLVATYGAVDRSGDYGGREVLDLVSRETPRNAVVIQHRSPLLYMTEVEGRRRDLRLWTYAARPDNPWRDAERARAAWEGRLYLLTPRDFPNGNARKRRQIEENGGYRFVEVERDTLYKVVPASG